MRFKVILAMVNEEHQDKVIQAAKSAGATGVTILNARGEGIRGQKSFFGLNVEAQREVLLFLVEDFNSDGIMEAIFDFRSLSSEPAKTFRACSISSADGTSALRFALPALGGMAPKPADCRNNVAWFAAETTFMLECSLTPACTLV